MPSLLLILSLLGAACQRPLPADTTVVAARAALDQGNPWRASRLLIPVLADPARRTPDVELLAATAASRWGGWTQVRALIAGRAWLDSLDQGAGHELLARAALALGDDSTAMTESRRALTLAADPAGRGIRRVLLARALDRLGQLDEAGVSYAAAAGELPVIGEWLRLRAVTALAAGPSIPTAGPGLGDSLVLAHVGPAIAAALERRGAWATAQQAYLLLGDTVSAARMAMALAPDSAARAALLAVLATPRPAPVAAPLLSLLDASFPVLTPAEQLIAARAAVRAGQSARAVAGFDAAFAAGLGSADDRFQRAAALVRSGRPGPGAAAFHALLGDTLLGVRALYEEGRALLRLHADKEARKVLLAVADRHPRDSTEAAAALFLLADQAADRGDDGGARKFWRRLARSYPADRYASTARFQAALVTYLRRDYRRAALAFDSLRTPDAGGSEANAAGYWSGRAWSAAKDTARARISWLELVARVPESYYATESARRIGASLPAVPVGAAGTSLAAPSRIADAEERIGWLRRAGLDQEAEWEVDALGAWVGGPDTLLAAATALSHLDEPALAARLARTALARGAADSAVAAHLLYPLDAGEVLVHEARAQGLDPAFAAALIRQESGFDPEAVSGAGARGLMQVMPDVGAALARRLHFPSWDPVLLFQPDVNLELGMAHLHQLFDRLKDPVRVLAAYNAGASRVKAWGGRHGADDPDIFIERIPFAETRDYVRTVLRNREVYRALYGW